MHETAAERERRLRQQSIYIGGGEPLWYDTSYIMSMWSDLGVTNPCVEIPISYGNELTLGVDPLIKFTKYKFNF